MGNDSSGYPARLPEVERALEDLDPSLDALRASKALRREHGPDLAREALELRELRRRAAGRFPGADQALLTSKGLEQTSHPWAASFRARTLAAGARSGAVLDGTCGLGADALALTAEGLTVIAADRDPHLAWMAEQNGRRAGLPFPAVAADLLHPGVEAPYLVADPDRRPGGKRELDPERGSPPLSALASLLSKVRGGTLKLAPGLDVERAEELLPRGLDHSWQWISAEGQLRELALWFGELASPAGREAIVLGDGSVARLAGEPESVAPLSAEVAAQVAFICEPDPGVIRSRLLGLLALEIGMAPLGPGLAFLGGDRDVRHPLVRTRTVLGSSSADPKRVRALLAAHDVGPVNVTKRGHPDSAETLAARFRGRGTRRGRLLVARLDRGHRVYLVALD